MSFAFVEPYLFIGYLISIALFGLLAVELATMLNDRGMGVLVHVLAGVLFLVSAVFVWRSFYAMRINLKADPVLAEAVAEAELPA